MTSFGLIAFLSSIVLRCTNTKLIKVHVLDEICTSKIDTERIGEERTTQMQNTMRFDTCLVSKAVATCVCVHALS